MLAQFFKMPCGQIGPTRGGPASPAGLTHRLGPWAFSSGAQGGREGWRQGRNPHSRVVGGSGVSADHCLGLGSARLLPAGEPGPKKGRGSGPGEAGDLCDQGRVPHETCSPLSGTPRTPALLHAPPQAGPLPRPLAELLCFLLSGRHWA